MEKNLLDVKQHKYVKNLRLKATLYKFLWCLFGLGPGTFPQKGSENMQIQGFRLFFSPLRRKFKFQRLFQSLSCDVRPFKNR